MNNIIQTKNDYNPDIERLVEENKFLKQKMLNDVHLRNEFKHLKKTMTDLVVKNNQTSKRPKRTMTDVEYEKILNTPIASIDFGENNTRIQNVLKFQDITTVAELVVLTKGQCMKFRHLGKHALFDIVAYLETKVLCLGMEVSWVEQYVKQENEKHKRLRL
ncbi:hypothetical protein KC866_03880 [Patescibacteria group bacterium]|nr:hypothetical protein [Patescibacteria group bacterium]